MTALPTLKRRSPKKRSGNMGCGATCSQRTKPTRKTAAATKVVITSGSLQPRSGPSMMPNSRAARPTSDNRAPRGSRGVALSSRDRGLYSATAAAVTATMGRFTRNAEPHQKRSSSAPDTIGPRAPPAPAKPTHMAMARRLSAGGKIAAMSESVAGMISAAPTPWTARPPMTTPVDPARPLISAPTPKTARPTRSAPFRPKRSPSAPPVRRRPANTSAKASTIHCNMVALAFSSLCIVGRATFSDDTAITTMTSERHMIPRRNQRRWWMAGWASSGRSDMGGSSDGGRRHPTTGCET